MSEPQPKFKPQGWLESLNCAIEGILWATRSQRHMRYHFSAAILVLLAALYLRISSLEFILLAIAITLVLAAELFNTAIEVVVDMIAADFHPLARRAKDVAAGAVLVASTGALVMGYLALSRYLFPRLEAGLHSPSLPPGELAVFSGLTVIILVVLVKATFGKGTPLHGGMPSGHAALAFSIATSMALSGAGIIMTLMALLLAGMVSHSRLLMRIHTFREVIVGALLGIGVTFVLHWLFT